MTLEDTLIQIVELFRGTGNISIETGRELHRIRSGESCAVKGSFVELDQT